MRAFLIAAILLCAASAEAGGRYGWYDPGYSFYTYDSPTWGYAASPYGMQTYNRVGRFTFYSNYAPVYQQFNYPVTPIVVPGYGYGGYGQARHLGF